MLARSGCFLCGWLNLTSATNAVVLGSEAGIRVNIPSLQVCSLQYILTSDGLALWLGIDWDGCVKQEPGNCFRVAWPLRVERGQLCTTQLLDSMLPRTLDDTMEKHHQTLQLNTWKL